MIFVWFVKCFISVFANFSVFFIITVTKKENGEVCAPPLLHKTPPCRKSLLHFKGLAVNTFTLCGIGFVSADHNLVK